MKTTLFSYEVSGTQNALWVEVNPANYKTVYPASGPQPPRASSGQIVKVSFNHTPGAYSPPNQLHWNLFDDGFGKCTPAGPRRGSAAGAASPQGQDPEHRKSNGGLRDLSPNRSVTRR